MKRLFLCVSLLFFFCGCGELFDDQVSSEPASPRDISSAPKPESAPSPKGLPDKDLFNFDEDGFNSLGFDRDGFNRNGRDKKGFDKRGFNKEGYDTNGFNLDGRDRAGFDKSGFNTAGYDKMGFDKNGFDKDGYDRKGYNSEGYDRDGISQIPVLQPSLDHEVGTLIYQQKFVSGLLYIKDTKGKIYNLHPNKNPETQNNFGKIELDKLNNKKVWFNSKKLVKELDLGGDFPFEGKYPGISIAPISYFKVKPK